ncbi:A24 family peptidase [Radiobacillus kanasensis]|uniref:prepilin peptidase n=1 Tax=Radiobacillus kanasensis TaxID=2844358 RepID=UPI001E552A0F|nr:A24 family peptidase [Radiobacillus kanasensis]UFT97928.1 A24 family peptidase [Radiobacillus kanasensis]
MQTIIAIYYFLLGTLFGSFFNVVGLRVPTKTFFQSQRSQCPSCSNPLRWFELIPILSFVIQSGKCRHCATPISKLYPLIEISTGFLFLFTYLHFGFQPTLLEGLLLVSLITIIIVSDLKYMLIPNRILIFFLPLFLVYSMWQPDTPWLSKILGASAGFVIIAIVILVSKGGMGAGDMKLFGVLGFVLGLKNICIAFFFSTIIGAIVSGLLLLFRLIHRKEPVPFGPFIAVGALISYFFGNDIWYWYVHIG